MRRFILPLLCAGLCLLSCRVGAGATFENSSHQMAAGNFDADAANEAVYIRAQNNWAASGGPSAGPIFLRDFNGGLPRVALPGVTATQVIAADINGDGRDEVVFIDGTTGFLRSFNFVSSSFTTHSSFAIQDVTAGQMDGDAQIELVTADAGTTTMRNYDAVTNTFSVAPFGVGSGAGNNVAANFNGNALTDFALRNGANYGNGGLFNTSDPYGVNTSLGGGLNRIATGNLDGAGDATDEVLLTNSANSIYVHGVVGPSPAFVQTTSTGTDPTVGNPENLGSGRELAYVINGGVVNQGVTTWNIASGATMTYTALRQTASNNASAAVTGNTDIFDIIAAEVTGDGFDEIIARKNADTGGSIHFFQNGTASLVQQNALVTLTASDGVGTSSFATAGNWSNAAAPSLANNYQVDTSRTLRTTLDVGGQTFGGASLTIQSGSTLSLHHSGTDTIDNLVLNGGTLLQGGNTGNTTITLAGSMNLTADSNVDTAGRNLVVSATVGGPSMLTKIGAGTLTLSAPTNHFGDLTVSAGTLELNGSSTRVDDLSGAGTITLTGASTLTVGGFNNNTSGNFSGVIQGAGGLTKAGTGIQILSGSSPNTFAGTTVVGEGTLTLSKTAGVAAISGPVQMGLGGTIQPFLRMTQDNQFGSGVVLTNLNAVNNWTWFEMQGTSQTLGGIQDTNGALVIENTTAATTSTLTVNNSANHTVLSHIRNNGGTVALTKEGTGTLTLGRLPTLNVSRVTYTGATIINNGTLELVDLNDTGSGVQFNSPITVNALGILEVDSSQPFATKWLYSQTLSGTGTFNKTGTGVFGITGVNTFDGQINIQAGRLMNDNTTADWSGATADVNISNGAVLDLRADDINVDALTGGATAEIWNSHTAGGTRVLTVGVANGSGTFAGSIRGTGTGVNDTPDAAPINLIKIGTGTQILSGTNTYSGTTTITNGVLEVAANNALGAVTNGTTVNGGGTLRLAVNSYSTAEPLTLNGTGYVGLAETGALLVDGAAVSRSFAGPITLGSNATIGVYNGSTLTLTGGINKAGNNITFLGDNTGSKAIINTTPISGAADVIVDAMTVDLNVANTYTGPTLVQNNGLLNLNVTNALPSPTFSNVTIQSGGEMNRAGGTSNTAASLTLNNGDVSGTGTLVLAGNVTSDNTSSMNGGTTNLNGNRTFTVNTGTLSVSDALIGAGNNLTKQGGGTMVVSGANTYSGQTIVDAGTFQLASPGSLQNSAVNVNAGTFLHSGGTNNVNGGVGIGNLNIASGAAYTLNGGILDFHDTLAASGHHAGGTASQINLTGTAAFNFNSGALQDISTINTAGGAGTFTQGGGQFFIGQDEPGLAGTANPANNPSLPDIYARTTTINGGFSLLQGGTVYFDAFGPEATPADYSDVEPIDLLRVTGTANLNGIFDFDDEYGAEFGDIHTLLLAPTINLGPNFAIDGGFFRVVPTGPTGPGFALQAIVPEPASVAVWMIIGLAGVAVAWRMRRVKSEE